MDPQPAPGNGPGQTLRGTARRAEWFGGREPRACRTDQGTGQGSYGRDGTAVSAIVEGIVRGGHIASPHSGSAGGSP
jgi:hypothetical protein